MMFINGCVAAEASLAQRPDICICSQLRFPCLFLKKALFTCGWGEKRSVLQQFVSWSALVGESAAAFIWCSRIQPQTFKTCSIVTRSRSVIDVFSPELTRHQQLRLFSRHRFQHSFVNPFFVSFFLMFPFFSDLVATRGDSPSAVFWKRRRAQKLQSSLLMSSVLSAASSALQSIAWQPHNRHVHATVQTHHISLCRSAEISVTCNVSYLHFFHCSSWRRSWKRKWIKSWWRELI